MRRLGHTVLLLTAVCIYAFGGFSLVPEYLSRKMEKQVQKTFGKEVVCNAIELPDSLAGDHKLFKISGSDSTYGYALISRALGCKVGGCDKPNDESKDATSFEQFFYMTAFNNGCCVKRVRVLEYSSNHGYQIANRGWLKQFEKDTTYTVGQNIDGISGATISVNSITKGVNQQVRIIRDFTRGLK